MGIAQGTGHMEGYEYRNPYAAPAAQVVAAPVAYLTDPGIHPAALAPASGQRQFVPCDERHRLHDLVRDTVVVNH